MAVSYPFPDTEVHHDAALLEVEEICVCCLVATLSQC